MLTKVKFTAKVEIEVQEDWGDKASIEEVVRNASRAAQNIVSKTNYYNIKIGNLKLDQVSLIKEEK